MQNPLLYTIKDSSATRFKCYNASNDKIQQMYADTNQLHKCLNFLLELNIFKNTKNTYQKMQNSSLYTITPLLQPDSNATIHETTRFSTCMQTQTNCIGVWIFCWNLTFSKPHTTHINRCRIHRSTRSRKVLQPDSNATIHQTTRFSNCMQTRTNCIGVWIFCWN